MKRDLFEELQGQLAEHDELVVLTENDLGEHVILDVTDVRFNSRDGRVELVVESPEVG